jgi:hypothetical protein
LLLDVEKAFNCVLHDALLHKLLEYCFPMVNIKQIWSFLTDRKFYVTVAGERSAECGIPSGVPHGAVLSQTLFNIFTSDFPNTTDVQLARFAEDSALFSTHAKTDVIIDRLQSALNTIKRYYATWRTKLNPSKTQAVWEKPVSFLLHLIYLWMATLFLELTVQSTWAWFWIRI